MATTSLKIERQNFVIENVAFPSYLVDMTDNNEYFVELKQGLQEVFTEFYHSESFKTNDNTEGFRILDYSLNKLFDDLFMAQHNGRINHMKEQMDKFENRDKGEPKKEVLN